MLSSTDLTPSPGAAMAVRLTRMMISTPLGVLKKRMTLCTAQSGRTEYIEPGGDDEALHTHARQQRNALLRIQNERSRRERVGEHRAGRDHGGARDPTCRLTTAWIKNMRSAFIVARRAHGPVRNAEAIDEIAAAHADGGCRRTMAYLEGCSH